MNNPKAVGNEPLDSYKVFGNEFEALKEVSGCKATFSWTNAQGNREITFKKSGTAIVYLMVIENT